MSTEKTISIKGHIQTQIRAEMIPPRSTHSVFHMIPKNHDLQKVHKAIPSGSQKLINFRTTDLLFHDYHSEKTKE